MFDLVGQVLGQTLRVFSSSRDGGRDGAFYGEWKDKDGSGMKGCFTVQCKFSSKDVSLTLAG